MDQNPYAAPNATIDPVAGQPGAPARVGFGPRFGAALIDWVVIAGLGFLVSGAVASWFPDYLAEAIARSQPKVDPKVAQQMAAMSGVMTAVARWSLGAGFVGALYGLIEGFTGRAVGKLLLGLRIAEADGHAASTKRLLTRMLLKQSGSLVAMIGMFTGVYAIAQLAQIPSWIIIAGFFVVLGQKRQALHDMAAKTAVYRNTDVVLADR